MCLCHQQQPHPSHRLSAPTLCPGCGGKQDQEKSPAPDFCSQRRPSVDAVSRSGLDFLQEKEKCYVHFL